MTAKEKALELVCRFEVYVDYSISFRIHTKMAATFLVDEVLIALQKADTAYDLMPSIDYWHKVKEEIELL